jgi:metal-sulfur cluster biosynthetic enzyme
MAEVKFVENIEITDQFRESVIQALSEIYDPELPLNIYDLGLIYEVHFKPSDPTVSTQGCQLEVMMTLTTPACPVAGSLPGEVSQKLKALPGVSHAITTLTWTPAWSKARLSPEHELLFSSFM